MRTPESTEEFVMSGFFVVSHCQLRQGEASGERSSSRRLVSRILRAPVVVRLRVWEGIASVGNPWPWPAFVWAHPGLDGMPPGIGWRKLGCVGDGGPAK